MYHHHLVRGGSEESVPSLPGEGEGVWRVYHHYLVRGRECGESPDEGRECGECTIITW